MRDEIGAQLGMRKMDKQIHESRQIGWNRGCHQKVLRNNFYIIKRQEDTIQEDQEANGLIFEDGTG
jgi:hypothetical protein